MAGVLNREGAAEQADEPDAAVGATAPTAVPSLRSARGIGRPLADALETLMGSFQIRILMDLFSAHCLTQTTPSDQVIRVPSEDRVPFFVAKSRA